MLGRISKWLNRLTEGQSRSRLLDEAPSFGAPGEDLGSLWGREKPSLGSRIKERLLSGLGHFTGLSTLSATISTGFQWVAQNNLTGGVYSPISNPGNIPKTYKLGTSSANNLTGGADQVFSFQQTIAAGGTADIDLYTMTNLLAQTSVNIARIKGAQLRLLSGADDSTINPTPTATSTCTVTNFGPPNPSPWWWQNGGSGATVDLTVSGGAVTAVASNQRGSGYPPSTSFLATPDISNTAAGGCVFMATSNSGGVITGCQFIGNQGGTNYPSNLANQPLIAVGQTNIYTGGAEMYFDISPLGFCLVNATSRKIRIINLDPVNAITPEIDVIAGST